MNDALSHRLVEAIAVTKVYRKATKALDRVSLTVHAGEVYGLVGRNGAGKTTLMRVIVGLVAATQGSIRIGTHSHRAQVGSLIEAPTFYPSMSGRDNLTLLCDYWRLPRRDADRSLDRVGLNLRDRGRPYRHYSLGMKQRLGVAAALLGNPEVVVLDEPTNGLDPESIVGMREIISSLRDDGCAVLLSSHLLSEVERVANRVGILSGGRLIAEGSVEELRRKLRARRSVDVEIDAPDEAKVVAAGLGLTLDTDAGKRLRFRFTDKTEAHELNSTLVGAGIRVSALTEASDSLEAAFLDLVAEQAPAEGARS